MNDQRAVSAIRRAEHEFARRAEHELIAAGEPARKRSVETRNELTAQEAGIARLARDGLSNPAAHVV